MTVLEAQIDEIHKHQWIEGVKAGHEVTEDEAALDWVPKYAEDFRKWWERNNKNVN